MTQEQRDRVMTKVRNQTAELLVATDVAARGLDIDHLTHVVNYDVPSAPDSYVHRIGRVGRAGREGVAITLVEPRQHRLLKTIEKATKQKIAVETLPTVADLRARRLELTRAALAEIAARRRLRAVPRRRRHPDRRVRPDGGRAGRGQARPRGHVGGADDDARRHPRSCATASSATRARAAAPRPQRRSGAGPRRSPARRTTIFVSLGHAAKVRPQDLVGAIANETSLSGRQIGAIEITHNFSTVEIPAVAEAEVIEALPATLIKGRKARVERYKPPPNAAKPKRRTGGRRVTPAPAAGHPARLRPGPDGARRDQAGQQRDALPAAAARGRARSPAAAADINRYPDNFSTELTAALAAQVRRRRRAGRASAAARCRCAPSSSRPSPTPATRCSTPGARSRPTRSSPRSAARSAVQVPLRAHVHDLDAMAAAITEQDPADLRLQPEQPHRHRGRPRRRWSRFLRAVPADVVVVLDEAYREFVTDADVPDGLTLLAEFPNLVVLRTFSKAYGLAGLRVGYAHRRRSRASPPRCARPRCRSRSPASRRRPRWPASNPRPRSSCCERVAEIVGERPRVRDALLALGYEVPPTQANFVWLPLGERTGAVGPRVRGPQDHRPALRGDGARVTIGATRRTTRSSRRRDGAGRLERDTGSLRGTIGRRGR